jgi:hypothetical protein
VPRDLRARRNADFFRALNERTHELEAEWLTSEPVAFVCECSELGCRAPVYLTVGEFREIRDRAGVYVAVPDHVDHGRERVVESTARYAVVADRDAES